MRAALDLDGDGRPHGAWLAGCVTVRQGDYVNPDKVYGEAAYDLVVTRLNANQQVLFSRSYDAGSALELPRCLRDRAGVIERSPLRGAACQAGTNM